MSLICPWVRRDLSRYADAELSCRRAARVERHLADCPACQSELDAIVALTRLVAGQEEPLPPDDAWERLDAALGSTTASGPAMAPLPSARRVPRFGARRLAWAAVVLIAAGLAFSAPALYRALGPRPTLAHDVDITAFQASIHDAHIDLNGPFARDYMLREVSAEEARKACPAGKGAALEVPSGFILTRVMLFETDCCQGMAAEYRRGDNWLTVVQIPNHHAMLWGEMEHHEHQVGLSWCEVHQEMDLCSLVHRGKSVNVLVVGDAEPQFLGEVATFLAARVEDPADVPQPGRH